MKVYIIYGKSSSSQSHWYTWLADQIMSNGFECIHVPLPNPENPDYLQCKQTLMDHQIQYNQDSIFIAHEFGVLSTLDLLSTHLQQGQQVKALFVISAFNKMLNAKPEYHQFIQQIDIVDEIIRSNIEQRFLFLSSNDSDIPAPVSIQLGHLLNAQMFEVKQAGQFRGQDGFNEFPQLWEKVKVLLKPTRAKFVQASSLF
ncbi:alpha/beta hydrolase [Acinetobacter piscicola]|uniref:alpha/beta hydrolase n=1 Tax=Acinetobacter piscicola TaxID=2006115 RepID=UPI0012FF7CF3|nr:alpha/beta hydrolase [Acinetobacter piscicola]